MGQTKGSVSIQRRGDVIKGPDFEYRCTVEDLASSSASRSCASPPEQRGGAQRRPCRKIQNTPYFAISESNFIFYFLFCEGGAREGAQSCRACCVAWLETFRGLPQVASGFLGSCSPGKLSQTSGRLYSRGFADRRKQSLECGGGGNLLMGLSKSQIARGYARTTTMRLGFGKSMAKKFGNESEYRSGPSLILVTHFLPLLCVGLL